MIRQGRNGVIEFGNGHFLPISSWTFEQPRMTDDQGFIASIIANPKDDLPRLIYADWLEEHGQEHVAEFIRIRVAIGRNHLLDHNEKGVDDCRDCEYIDVLELRSRELKPKIEPFPFASKDDKNAFPSVVHQYSYYRGFIGEIWMTFTHWNRFADPICKKHPVEKVHLSTFPQIGNLGFGDVVTSGQWVWFANRGIHTVSVMDGTWEYLFPKLLKLNWPKIEFLSPDDRTIDGSHFYYSPDYGGVEQRVREQMMANIRSVLEE